MSPDYRREGKAETPLRDGAALAEHFSIALAQAPVVVFNQDKLLRYTWINSPVLCWAVKEYIGRTDNEIVGGAEGERLTTIKKQVLETGVPTRSEAAVTFNSETHYFDLTVKPLRNGVGSIEGVTCACTDITPLRRALAQQERLNEELAKRNAELEALHQEKTYWLAVAAHDLRNPLLAILFGCEALKAEPSAMTVEQLSVLGRMQSSLACMSTLLDDLLDISAIELGQHGAVREPIDLWWLIKEAVTLSLPLANRKGIHIEAPHPGPIPNITLDRPKMMRVFLNLIGNSIKFCQKGTLIQIQVTLKPTNLVVYLQDNGPGVPAQELESIFLPFKRGEGPGSFQPGHGLGLAICKRIVELHGGRIWAENATGGGAVFCLSLPLDASSRDLSRQPLTVR